MNAIVQEILIQQSKVYKSNYEKQEKYKQLFQETLLKLETAQKKRETIGEDFQLIEQDPVKVREMILTYDKVIIPDLRKKVKTARDQYFKHGTYNWYDLDFLLFASAAMTSVIILVIISAISTIGALIMIGIAGAWCGVLMYIWRVYRRMIKKIAFEEGV